MPVEKRNFIGTWKKIWVSKIYPEINKIINIECNIKDTPTVLNDFINIYVNYEGNTYKPFIWNHHLWIKYRRYFLKSNKIEFEEDYRFIFQKDNSRIISFDSIENGNKLDLKKFL